MNESDNIQSKETNSQNISTSLSQEKSEDLKTLSESTLGNSKNDEISEIKSEKKQSEFEIHIIEAYKIITGFYQKQNNNKVMNEKEDINDKKLKESKKIQQCEKEVRLALINCIEDQEIELNKNIIDKISRIIYHNKINILLILGKIFINLMNREKLFDSTNKKIDIDIIVSFVNEICNLNLILKETYLGNKLSQTSIKFIEKIITDFNFEEDQFSAMKNIININSENQKPNKLNLNSLEEMIISIYELEQSQENYYMQYKIITSNYDNIIEMINKVDINDKNNLNNYIELGKILAYLLYNKKYVLFIKKQVNLNENKSKGITKLLYNGSEDDYFSNFVEGEKYYIEYDDEIDRMREKLCDIIIKYAEKNKSNNDIYEFQYVLFVLIKRVYFHYYDKYKEKIEPILADIMINLCLFKNDSNKEVEIFINEILDSKDTENNNLKNILKSKLDSVKENPDLQYQQSSNKENEPNDNNYFISLENISIEAISLLENDLKIGYFLTKKINSGDKFTFYTELSESFGIIDFCVSISEYNIKLSIINLTEGKEIINSNEINEHCSPFKLVMFFTKPVILKFKFDNSYSWIREKNIKYKLNIFYPQEPFYIVKQISLLKYQEAIFNHKNFNSEEETKINLDKNKANNSKNIFMIKFNAQNKAYNCIDVMKNIETSNKMIKDNFISINSIFIEKNNDNKSYFYFNNDNGELLKAELTIGNFNENIKTNILDKSKVSINIINLYIISGDSNIIDDHYITIEEILGFVPDIKNEKNNEYNTKTLFFMQYLHQAQLIYALFQKFYNKETYDIVILINYTIFGGYQICLYKKGEIIINPKNFKKINKNESIEKNVDLIVEEIKKFGDERRIDILICESIDEEEKEFDVNEIYKLFKDKLNIIDEDESDYKIKKMNKEFNNQVFCNSHIFYFDQN